MSEKAVVSPEALPYVELVIRPADTRPIVIQLPTNAGAVFVSEGTTDDMHEAEAVLNILANVVSSTYTMRRVLKDIERAVAGEAKRGDDDPPW